MSSGPLSAPSSPADALAPRQNAQQDLSELRELPPATTLKFHREHPLFDDLAPEEGYNHEGVYWVSTYVACVSTSPLKIIPQADLPPSARRKWVNAQSNTETKRELSVVWEMFKADPLSPLTAYCRRYVIGGFGLFTEGYT